MELIQKNIHIFCNFYTVLYAFTGNRTPSLSMLCATDIITSTKLLGYQWVTIQMSIMFIYINEQLTYTSVQGKHWACTFVHTQ